MFGKPAWFRKKTVGLGAAPCVVERVAVRRGVWASSVCHSSACWPIICCGVAGVGRLIMVALLWDVHQVRRDMDTAHRKDTGRGW